MWSAAPLTLSSLPLVLLSPGLGVAPCLTGPNAPLSTLMLSGAPQTPKQAAQAKLSPQLHAQALLVCCQHVGTLFSLASEEWVAAHIAAAILFSLGTGGPSLAEAALKALSEHVSRIFPLLSQEDVSTVGLAILVAEQAVVGAGTAGGSRGSATADHQPPSSRSPGLPARRSRANLCIVLVCALARGRCPGCAGSRCTRSTCPPGSTPSSA